MSPVCCRYPADEQFVFCCVPGSFGVCTLPMALDLRDWGVLSVLHLRSMVHVRSTVHLNSMLHACKIPHVRGTLIVLSLSPVRSVLHAHAHSTLPRTQRVTWCQVSPSSSASCDISTSQSAEYISPASCPDTQDSDGCNTHHTSSKREHAVRPCSMQCNQTADYTAANRQMRSTSRAISRARK